MWDPPVWWDPRGQSPSVKYTSVVRKPMPHKLYECEIQRVVITALTLFFPLKCFRRYDVWKYNVW